MKKIKNTLYEINIHFISYEVQFFLELKNF
jgi:hypothetical protein